MKFTTNELVQLRLEKKIADNIPMLSNYTHFKFEGGGVVLISNKNFDLPDVFISLKYIVFILFK